MLSKGIIAAGVTKAASNLVQRPLDVLCMCCIRAYLNEPGCHKSRPCGSICLWLEDHDLIVRSDLVLVLH